MVATRRAPVQRAMGCVLAVAAGLLSGACRNGFAASLPAALARTDHASTRAAATPVPHETPTSSAASVQSWQVSGVLIRVAEATVAPDGPGAFRVRVTMDVTGQSYPSIALAPSRFGIMGEATLQPAATHVPTVRLAPGDTVRTVLTWQLRADARPSDVQLVWNGPENTAPGAQSIHLADAPPTSVWLRAFRPRPPAERVVLADLAEVRLGAADSLVRMAATITNGSDEPIELSRDAFHVESEGTPMELVTESTTSRYYGALTGYCGVTGAWLPDHAPILPGQSVTGTLCFRRPRTQSARILRVTYGNTLAPTFNATVLVPG